MPTRNPQRENYDATIEAAKELTGRERYFQVRKNAQHALIYFADDLSINNQRFYTREENNSKLYHPEIPAGKHSYEEVKSSDPNPQRWLSGYRNIIPIIRGSSQDPISPITSIGKEIKKFFTFELDSQQIAMLVPKIRLYKVEYPIVAGKVQFKKADGSSNGTEKEIKFPKALSDDEFNILTDGGGNIGGSGIESFEWALKGVNPAEVDSNIEASVKIYFNNITVFKERIENMRNLGAAQLQALPAHFIDLITFAPPINAGVGAYPCNEQYKGYYFEVMAEVGWDLPDNTGGIFTSEQREFIKNSTVKLHLSLTDHKFDFKEDGSATLTANYRARYNLSDRVNDILSPLSETEDAAANLRRSEELNENVPSDERSEEVKQREEELEDLLKKDYKRIVKNLIKQMYVADIPNALLLNTSYLGGETQTQAGSTATRRVNQEYVKAISYDQLFNFLASADQMDVSTAAQDVRKEIEDNIDRINAAYNSVGQITAKRNIFSVGFGGQDSEANFLERVMDVEENVADDQHTDQLALGITTGHNLSTQIRFLYLGDILECVLETVDTTEQIANKNLAFVTTDFQYHNMFKILQNVVRYTRRFVVSESPNTAGANYMDFAGIRCKQQTFSKSTMSKFISNMNFANIPIEAHTFFQFFTENVVASKRQNYYLNSFLNDLFNRLVKPVLGSSSVLGVPQNQPALINAPVTGDNASSALFIEAYSTPNVFIGAPRRRNAIPRGNASQRDNEYVIGHLDYPDFPNTGNPNVRAGVQELPPGIEAIEDQYTNIRSIDVYNLARGPNRGIINTNPATPKRTATIRVLGINQNIMPMLGKYEENIESNISNFIVGLDKGVIKAVAFERVDQPYLRESRTAQDKSFGVGQLRELYNVKLTLYGNNTLKPGEMIYVEPNRFSFGRPTEPNSVARVLGLGGYHMVVDVSHSISDEGWETNVKALHIAVPALETIP